MSRPVAEHFNQAGRPKRSFKSKVAAEKHVSKWNLNAYAYQCSFCGHWHIATIK